MRSRNCYRRAFVLPMTLAIIVLTAIVMAGFARQSLLSAVQSNEAQRDLQRRWGGLSCQRSMLDRAELLLVQSIDGPRPRRLRLEIALGEFQFEMLLADENAKLNVNTAAALGPLPAVRQSLYSLQGRAGDSRLPIRLSPSGDFRLAGDQPPHFSSWSQVFAMDPSMAPDAVPGAIARATSEMTLWGDGKTNLRAASEETVLALANLAADRRTAAKLHSLRATTPAATTEQLVAALGLGERERARFKLAFADASRCFSLWLLTTSANRQWQEFHVVGSVVDAGSEQELEGPADLKPGRLPTLARFVW